MAVLTFEELCKIAEKAMNDEREAFDKAEKRFKPGDGIEEVDPARDDL